MSGNNSSVYEECAEVLVDLYDRKYRRKTRAASEEEERMLQEVKADFLAWPVMKRPARLLVEALEALDVQKDEVPEMLRVILLGTDGLSSDAEQKSDDQESKILHSWIEMITSYVEGKVSHVRPSASLDRDPDVENSGNSTVMGTPRSHESQRDVLSRPTTVSRDDVKTNQAAPFHLAKFHLNFTTYAGAKNKCAQWWETFQEEASLHRVDDRAMILLMKNQLKGKALNYFVELKERLREQTKFVTADALAKGLINHFDYRRLEHLQMEWRMLAQKEGETFADFELRCRRTVRDLKSLGDTVIDLADDEAYLEAVWQRCNRDKYRMLKCTSKCKSVDELAAVIKEVLQEDAKGPASTTTVEGSVNVTTQGKRVVKCFRCQEEGHIRRNCPKRKKKGGRDLSKVTCYKCQQQGHYQRDCPSTSEDGKTTTRATERKTNVSGSVNVAMARQPPSREQLAEDPTVFRKLAACELEVEVPGRSIDKHRTYWKRVASHLDTCAEVDCISPSFVRALNIPTEPATGVLKGVGNISSNVAEVVQLNVRVPGKKQAVWRHIVFAVTEVPGHILFSNPTLTRMGATISLAEGEVCLGGHKIPLIRTDEWPTNKVMATKALLKTVKQVLGGQDHVKEFRRLESMVDIGPAEANQRLQQLLEQYKDVFKDNGQPAKLPPLHLPDFMKEEHKGRVINIPPRQWSSKEEAILDEQVEQFLEAGIVAPCNSKWNTRQVLVKKANGSWRPCMDFTALNKLLKDYSYPLPKISDIMATIGRSKPRFFSTLDLMKAFMQWGLTEESQEMTAFTTKKGKYCFTRLPFGLKVASEVYQEGMAAAFGDALLYIALLIFIDDLLVFTKTRRGHLFVLEKVFEVSRALNLKLSQEKCLFLQEEVTYVGRRINAKGEEPAQAHLDAIREIPVPTNKSELRSFLAAAQYTIKPYAPTFSRLAADLWKMTSLDQKIKFKWKEEHQQKFQAIKDLCVQQLRKNHFDDDKPVELYTDGSKQGVAGVLVQEDKVVAIVSRVLKASEKNYHPVEFEMLAVAYAMNSFAHYLRGRHFTLYTDHKPLLGVLRKLDVENSRLQNLKLKVSEFSFTAKHVKGVDNKADYWTRLFGESPEDGVDEEKENEETEETESRVHVVVRSFDGKYSDADMETILKMDHRKTACGYEVKQGDSWRLYVPEDARTSLLWETHRDRHQGVTYMEKELRRYYWPAMRSSVQVFVEACKCAAAKEVKPRKNRIYKPVRAEAPGDMLAMDLYYYDGVNYLTAMDVYSAFPFVYALREDDEESRQEEIKHLFTMHCSLHGAPNRLLTDMGPEFNAIKGVQHLRTSSYHPATNGKLERFHRELGNLSRVHGNTPDRVVHLLQTEANRRLFHSQHKAPVQFDPEAPARRFAPGDLVMRHVPRRSRQKQEPVYRGPMKVLEATTDRSYRVQGADNRVHRVHVDDIKRYSLPNANNLQVNPTVLAESMEECKFADVTPPQQLAYALEEDWADKQVYLGVIFSDLELKCVLDKVKATKGAQVLMVIPELRFYDSYKWMEQGQDLSVYWIGLPQEEDVLLTADDQPAGLYPFKMWMVHVSHPGEE